MENAVGKDERSVVTQAEYDRAIELWPGHVFDLVRNLHLVPNWIGDEDRFWVKLQDETGHRFKIVDAATGESVDAFDHEMVAAALKAEGVEADAEALPLSRFEFMDEGRAVLAVTAKGAFKIDLPGGTAAAHVLTPATEVAGPTGETLFLKDDNLWIRAVDGAERALTDNGEPNNAWGVGNDYNMRKVARNRGEIPLLPTNLFWSPDGKRILAEQVDEREVEPYPYLEFVPADGSVRPKVHFIRNVLIGEPPRPSNFAFIDIATKAQTPLLALPDGLGIRPDIGEVWWSEDEQFLYAIAQSLDGTMVAFVEFEIATGAYRIVHRETATTFFDFNTYLYNLANVRLRKGGGEVIWYSQRDGWGHLYAIDIATGASRQLTEGPWAVADIIGVTDEHVFFTAVGREPGRHPYYRHLYRIDSVGAEPNAGLKLLTPDDADHGFPGEPAPAVGRILGRTAGLSQLAPSGRYFVDAVSRVDQPTRFLIRNIDGVLVAEFARADITALQAAGWQPPEIFTAKAADGETDLYGVLIKPRDFDPAKHYPVVEHIYGGPQIAVQPRTFLDGLNGSFVYAKNTLADLGFVVAVLDGPGTPYRSKAFHDLTYGKADRWGIAHHRAALEGAAATRPWMDLSRVGVHGHSFGGYGTVAAMLHAPDFYKVGVSSAGMYDVAWSPSGHEHYFGLPEYGEGRAVKNGPDEVAANHAAMSPSYMADRLEGQLMLAVGDLDENIQPSGLFHFADALIKAGKSFDLLFLPGRNHGFSAEAYFHKRSWDYFIEHLQHRKPLQHYMPQMRPGVRMFI